MKTENTHENIDDEAAAWERFSSRNRRDLKAMEKILDVLDKGGRRAQQAIDRFFDMMENLEQRYEDETGETPPRENRK